MRETITSIVAILSIGGLTALALSHGIDGAVLMTALTIIGGLGGYSVGKRRGKSSPPAKTLPQPLSDMDD